MFDIKSIKADKYENSAQPSERHDEERIFFT